MKLVIYHYVVFCLGCAVSALIGVNLYEATGFSKTFYASAGAAAAAAVSFGALFALRLETTSSGLTGGLAVAEQELQGQRQGSTGDPEQPTETGSSFRTESDETTSDSVKKAPSQSETKRATFVHPESFCVSATVVSVHPQADIASTTPLPIVLLARGESLEFPYR